ncbi:hypothetical protein UYSO10_5208 [Kosakonia radicincitans]|nr:hypothetical protein UYSO10_5208 [Kosakonia radicincitans]
MTLFRCEKVVLFSASMDNTHKFWKVVSSECAKSARPQERSGLAAQC